MRKTVWVAGLVASLIVVSAWASTAGATAPTNGGEILLAEGAAAAGAAREKHSAAYRRELAAFEKAIGKKYALKERAFATHHVKPIITQFYTADAISVGAGEGIYIGREQLTRLYRSVINRGAVKIDSVYPYVNGNAGWDWADFHVTPSDPKEKPFTFAILFLWSKIHGQWMCKGDFFVTGSLREGKLAQ